MPHADEGTLHALLDGSLRAESPDEADRVEAHLRTCEDCRARYESAAGTREAASVILGHADVEASPDFADVLRRAGEERGARAGSTTALARQTRWTRRAAWAASLVIALGTGYLVGERFGGAPGTGTVSSMAAPTEPGGADEQPETRPGEPAPTAAPGPSAGSERRARPAAPVAQRQAADAVEEESPGQSRSQARAGDPGGAEAKQPAEAEQTAEARQAEEADQAAEAGRPLETAAEARARRPDRAERTAGAAPGEAARDTAVGSVKAAAPDAAELHRDAPVALEAIVVEGVSVTAAEQEPVWRSVDLATARRAVADSLYVLPRAEPREAFVAGDGRRVLTVQRLSSGVIVQVVQRRPDAAAPAAADTGEAVPAPEPEPEPEQPRMEEPADSIGEMAIEPAPAARAVVGGFVLEVTGPLPTELLEILATSAKPLPR